MSVTAPKKKLFNWEGLKSVVDDERVPEAAPTSMSQLNQMPPSVCEEYIQRNERLLQRLTAAAGDDKEQCPIASEIDSGMENTVTGSRYSEELTCPMMTIEESSRLTISWKELSKNPDKARAIFDEFGVMIVTGVCNKEETEIQEELWKSDLLALAGDSQISNHTNGVRDAYERLGQEGPRSWPKGTFLGTKFANIGGLSHGAYAWACRTNLKVRKVFSELYQDDDLLVGVDNVFFSSEKSPPLKANEYWLHADQSTKENDILCIQSVLYTWSSETPDASTTVVCPGTHKDVFKKLMVHTSTTEHYVPHSILPREVRESFYQLGRKEARRIPAPAGSLVLWNSKLSHQGWKGGSRLAMPICWEPASRRSEEARRRKLHFAIRGIPSTHWASMGTIHPLAINKLVPYAASNTEVPPSEVSLPLYPSVVPFPVKPNISADWQKKAEAVWNWCSPITDEQTTELESMLKSEAIQVL